MKNPVLRSLAKLAVFSLPVAAVFAYPAWVLWNSGEFSGPQTILKIQESAGPDVLVGLAHSEPWGHLKAEAVKRRKPRIVALGSSRVLSFRQTLFNRPFYNAGGGARTVGQFRRFIKSIPEKNQPDWLVIGLDQNFFNVQWDPDPIDNFRKPSPHEWLLILADRWHRIYLSRFENKFSEDDLFRRSEDGMRRIGMTALVKDEGYLKDGAYRWNVPEESKFDQEMQWISNNERFLVRSRKISRQATEQLTRFLDRCQRRGIRVVAYLPPYSPTVYERLKKTRRGYAHVFELGRRLHPIFEKRGIPYMDFSDPASIPAADADFIDGQHLTYAGAQKLWSAFCSRFPELREITV